jgi:tetratricopeptide (TPR) repeat protein
MIGWCLARLGSYAEAASHCRRALAAHRAIGDEDGQAEALDSLGLINHHLGRYGQSVTDLEEALRLFRQGGDRYAQAQVLDHLGDTRAATGDETLARAAWRESLAILHELAHPDAGTMRAKLDALR